MQIRPVRYQYNQKEKEIEIKKQELSSLHIRTERAYLYNLTVPVNIPKHKAKSYLHIFNRMRLFYII